jgi:hypothetical protein
LPSMAEDPHTMSTFLDLFPSQLWWPTGRLRCYV